jgi:DNA-binding transcriptional regulator WhiA
MLVASELKGELARIHPARACCRRAELAGLLYVRRSSGGVSTLEHSTARVAVHLAASLRIRASARPATSQRGTGVRIPGGRHHLEVSLDDPGDGGWRWADAKPCDRRAFLRGVLLSGSISLTRSGPHVEFVLDDGARARELVRILGEMEMKPGIQSRRGRSVVYLKGREQLGMLLRLTGANRALLDLESDRVARDVRNRVNRLLNAEEANLGRTVRAADRQLQAISRLEASGEIEQLPETLREAALQRRRQPDADLDTLAASLGVSRSAMNHRLRKLVALADAEEADEGAQPSRRSA